MNNQTSTKETKARPNHFFYFLLDFESALVQLILALEHHRVRARFLFHDRILHLQAMSARFTFIL